MPRRLASPAAGFQFQLSYLTEIWPLALAYVVLRSAGKVFGTWLGVKWAGIESSQYSWIGGALLCQAAVQVGLADFVVRRWTGDPWAADSACYLSDAEIGVKTETPRLEVTPFRGVRHVAAAE